MADINVWLALAWSSHRHSETAWTWFRSLSESEVLFCRFTQIGLLRLLNTQGVMGDDCLTLGKAWALYDRCMADPRVGFRQEPAELEHIFRHTTAPLRRTIAPKAIGDGYLLALSQSLDATLVTFDRGISALAGRLHQDVLLLT